MANNTRERGECDRDDMMYERLLGILYVALVGVLVPNSWSYS